MYKTINNTVYVDKQELINAYWNLLRKLKMTDKKWQYMKEILEREIKNDNEVTENEYKVLIVMLANKLYK